MVMPVDTKFTVKLPIYHIIEKLNFAIREGGRTEGFWSSNKNQSSSIECSSIGRAFVSKTGG